MKGWMEEGFEVMMKQTVHLLHETQLENQGSNAEGFRSSISQQ